MTPAFNDLFKKYRLKAEFATLSDFGMALSEKGFIYEDSIFSHWQKGTRIPNSRILILTLVNIFAERNAIKSLDEINEFLESTNQGSLTKKEIANLPNPMIHKAIFQIPNALSNFIGRETIIDSFKNKNIHGKIFYIYGCAGVGKTTLAIRLGHLLKNEFPDGILWYRLDTTKVKDILLSIIQTFKEDIPSTVDLDILSNFARSCMTSKKMLLILDNAEIENNLNLLLPNSSIATIIITSRYKNLPFSIKSIPILLDNFNTNEILTLFNLIFSKNYINKYHNTILQIGKSVGNLPLAISIFVKNLNQSSINPKELLHRIENEEILLSHFSYEDRNLYLAISLGYKNLSEKTKSVFLSLGAFEGKDFSLDALSYINGISKEKIKIQLDELVNNSLVETSVKNKLRIHPMIKKFLREKLENPYFSILTKLIAIIFIFFTIFWIILQIKVKPNNFGYHLFGDTYFIVALLGGLWGITTAKKWGEGKSSMGKAIFLFSLGLLFQTFGQIAYSFYDIFLHIGIPYPSIGDVGYFGYIPLYIYGILLLARASGVKIGLYSVKKNLKILFVSIIILGISYFFILQQYTFNWHNPIKIILDFGYSLGDITYVYFALLTYIQIKTIKKGIMKNKILIILVAFIVFYLADFIFVIQANRKTFIIGQTSDYIYFMAYLLMTLGILRLNHFMKQKISI